MLNPPVLPTMNWLVSYVPWLERLRFPIQLPLRSPTWLWGTMQLFCPCYTCFSGSSSLHGYHRVPIITKSGNTEWCLCITWQLVVIVANSNSPYYLRILTHFILESTTSSLTPTHNQLRQQTNTSTTLLTTNSKNLNQHVRFQDRRFSRPLPWPGRRHRQRRQGLCWWHW